jgi:signal transduction histidine kinase
MYPKVLAILLPLVLCLTLACKQAGPQPRHAAIETAPDHIYDSIIILDSLVNASKIADPQQSLQYARVAMAISQRFAVAEIKARAALITGTAYAALNPDSSYKYFTRALHIARINNLEQLLPGLYYDLAQLYKTASDYKTAVLFADTAIRLATRTKDNLVLANAYNMLGNLKFDLTDTSDAQKYYQESYAVAEINALPKQQAVALASLARLEINDLKKDSLYTLALQILERQTGNEEEIAMICNNIGNRKHNPDSAIRYFSKAISSTLNMPAGEVVMAAFNNMAYSYLEKGDTAKAADCLTGKAIPLAIRNNNYDWLATLYDSYADVLSASGKHASALVFEKKALTMTAMHEKQQAGNQLRLLLALLDTKNKELKLEKSELDNQHKANNIQKLILWFSLALLIALTTIGLIGFRMQRNRMRYQTEMLKSAKKIIAIDEVKNERIAMELHDLVSPIFLNISKQIQAAAIPDKEVSTRLESAVNKLSTSIREISHRISNKFIRNNNIKQLVSVLCEDMSVLTEVPIRYTFWNDAPILSQEQTIQCYRIIVELLTNAVKYVHSGEINISLTVENKTLSIKYWDNGCGFDPAESEEKGMGLTSIRERARILNGTTSLISTINEGTRWYIGIPI